MFVQLLTRIIHSNLEVHFTILQARQADRRVIQPVIFTVDGRITIPPLLGGFL